MNNDQLFVFLWNGYNKTITEGLAAVVASGLAAVGTVMIVIITAYLLVVAFLVITGDMAWDTGFRMMLRLFLIDAILTPSLYNQFVTHFFLTDLPEWIASNISGTGGPDADVMQYERLREAVEHYSASLMAQATGFSNIGNRIIIWAAEAVDKLLLLCSFIVWFFARVLMVLMVALGPFVIPGYLFNKTREITDRWIGKLIGLSILSLLISILNQIVLVQNVAYMRLVEAKGGGGLDTGISTLIGLGEAFFTGLALMIVLPAIAAYIGGGISFVPTPIQSIARILPGRSR